jgi:thiamine-monophosphate kinase
VNPEISSLLVREIGEQGLLARVQSFCPQGVVGDDAAVLETLPGRSLVVTTDVLVDQVHFSDRTTSPEDAGWRAVAANLSDLAAMGANPLGITIGLGIPGELSVSWVERLYQGMTACLQQHQTAIVGGDICRSPVITLAITAFGQVSPHQIIRRSAAQVGDAIVVTGFHGGSRAGLELLLHPNQGQSLSLTDRELLIQAHQRPQPRLDVLPHLAEIFDSPDKTENLPTPSHLRVAGMDSSDGLADAIVQICRASQVGAKIERSWIPILPALTRLVSPTQAVNWALYGGEDFELVLCLAHEKAQSLVKQLGTGAAIVGTITTGSDVLLVDTTGVYPDECLTLNSGFQHFGV